MKGSWRRYIREWLKGRTSESRGWPRTRWMPVSTRVRWKGCDGRMDRRRVVAGASTLSVQPALWATTSPPLGCRRSGGRGGAMPVGGGLAKPASAARLLAEGWIGAAPDARARFPAIVETANSGIELDARGPFTRFAKMYAFLRLSFFPRLCFF